MKYCTSRAPGANGSVACTPGEPKYRIFLSRANSHSKVEIDAFSCENHLQVFIKSGWVVKLGPGVVVCAYCSTNEAIPNSMEAICEACLDKATEPLSDSGRLKAIESGYCVNRDNAIGCNTYAEAGTVYCAFCRQHVVGVQRELSPSHKPKAGDHVRVKPIPTVTRPCILTPNCPGNMEATVKRYTELVKPQLWWFCLACNKQWVADAVRATVDTSKVVVAEIADEDGGDGHVGPYENIPEPLMTDAGEAFSHMRAIIHEDRDQN